MVDEIWASVISSFVDQLVALNIHVTLFYGEDSALIISTL